MIGQNPPEASPGEPQPVPGSDPVPPPAPDTGEAADTPPDPPVEYGGREGPDPVRYGDWEKNGRCIDF
ncbi:DUF1674 domain-containing protein [Novilysobacter defluvii]|uniref:DUF1674 domain-containing protein n=1 Tax=Lysobacter defluvii IMMIB APB-9 = DSM 18482 TaxID=1385515 RepID=A0A0A0M8G0_9GAMM|nr:DUF1674 domain-containing protein [Lysobacter defluvii]KGO99365.1 hypothetical protein N791_08900 [Lysobacter defluvii IMMIB APB-9 = DSM 18482]